MAPNFFPFPVTPSSIDPVDITAVDLPPLSASFSPEKSMVISSNWVGLFPSLLILSVTVFALLPALSNVPSALYLSRSPTPENVPSFVLNAIS